MKLLIIGGGGHGKVIAYTALSAGHEVAGFLDDGVPSGKEIIPGIRCLGPVSAVTGIHGATHFLAASGDNNKRKEWFREFSALLPAAVLIHPTATVFPDVKIGMGTVVLAHASLMCGVVSGENVVINAGVVVDHDSTIGDHVFISPGAVIGSRCLLGEMTRIETGEIIKPGTSGNG
ncbi:MAG: hypothetical protein IT233_11035 [Bacteroidia bacterium]|nr:hypothetical protein [Bacteroidia bacterium]